MVCTTSSAGCGGYKRMLERKKLYTEPAGKKEWSGGGQANSLFIPALFPSIFRLIGLLEITGLVK